MEFSTAEKLRCNPVSGLTPSHTRAGKVGGFQLKIVAPHQRRHRADYAAPQRWSQVREIAIARSLCDTKGAIRRLAASINERNEKRIGFPPLPPDAWNSWSTIDVDADTIHTLDFGTLEHVQINELELTTWLSRPRRGPLAGKIARYADDDRALFASIERIMSGGNKSLTEAVRDLDYERKLKGRGTPESRVRRVTRLFQKERRPVGQTRSH